MAINNNVDFIVHYDADLLTQSTRILSPSASDAQEHAAQCAMLEILRDILATGITLAEWNAPEPWSFQGQDWATYQEARWSAGHGRAKLNVASPQVPLLTQTERDTAGNMANNFFERGYTDVMAGTQQVDKMTFTRTGGL